MAGQVRANTDQMDRTGREIQRLCGEISTQCKGIEDISTGLLGRGWQGEAATVATSFVATQAARAMQLGTKLMGHGEATSQGAIILAGQEATATAQQRVLGGLAQTLNPSV